MSTSKLTHISPDRLNRLLNRLAVALIASEDALTALSTAVKALNKCEDHPDCPWIRDTLKDAADHTVDIISALEAVQSEVRWHLAKHAIPDPAAPPDPTPST